MSAAINPYSNDHNFVVVNGIRSPGRAQLSEVGKPYNWQIQEGYGLSGGFCTFRGRGIAKFTLTIALWLPEHFVEWAFFAKALEPPTPTKPFFVEMQHPLLAAADIKAVGVENFGQPVRQPAGGVWLATIKLLEYRPPLPAIVKPNKSIPSVDKGKPTPPKTEADRALLEATKNLDNAINAGRTSR